MASHRSRSSALATSAIAILLLAVMATLPHAGVGYNIDLPSYTRHRITPNTMFGFSIAFHKGQSGYQQKNSLIVGAPKFDTSSYQPNVVEAGAVFKCGMNDDDCNLVKFDSSGNNHNTLGDTIDKKSYQWLGATVASSRDNDFVVACAPRYVFHSMNPTTSLRYDPVGTCFSSRDFTKFNEISPCRTNFWGYHRQGFCQAGFSAAASNNGSRLFIGAPGSWYWQGQAYSVSADATFDFKPSYYQPFGTGGQTYSHDVTRPENQVYSTGESGSQDDDSYLGYSMTTGDFNGDRIEDVAIGMPRGAGLLGKIVVNTWNMANIFNITGKQIGEYFGYSLATCDVDGDGLDDLIIGAPMYSEPGNVEGKYDVGRVYVLLQNSAKEAEHIRYGSNSKGRFGLALASLGDVNRDGYGDFAVGAPYDGPEGRGVVYIFHGSVNGPLEKPSQIIKSEDIVEGAPYPRTFGFALAGGVDMDGNTYPDLAVGAYSSDQAFIFKSRPVASVNANTVFVGQSKLINLDERNCELGRSRKQVPCTEIMTCWSYTGYQLPRMLEFDVSWVLDVKKPKRPRMFFVRDETKNIRNQTIVLEYDKTFCRNETVYLMDNIRDKLTPLEVEMRYNLRSKTHSSPVLRRKREALDPVIDQNREIILRDAINIQKNCGADNVCEPDLHLDIKTVDKYLFGSQKPLVIEVLIANMNEDAFEAAFYMVIPKDVDYKKIDDTGDKGDIPIVCTAPTEDNNYTLKCDIGNPLQSNKTAKFNVILLPTERVGMASSYDFFMEANSTNVEKPGSHFDNIIRKNIGIWVETDFEIDGTSLPDFELYKASDFKTIEEAKKEEDLGPQVVHLYNIRNKGPSTIEEAVILIHYPYQTISGDLLMYMTNQPETDNNIVCDPHIMVNSRNLELDQALVHKSFLEQRGVVVHTKDAQASSSVFIEKAAGESGGVATGRTTKVLTVEERRRLKIEDAQETPGDGSLLHSQRANGDVNTRVSTSGGFGGSGGGAGSSSSSSSSSSGSTISSSSSSSSSWNSTVDEPSIVVQMRNSSVFYDASGRPHVQESSTEYVTRVGAAPNYNAQRHSANYQQIRTHPSEPAAGQATYHQATAQYGPAQGVHQAVNPSGSAVYQESHVTYGNPTAASNPSYSVRANQQQYPRHGFGSSATYNDFSTSSGGAFAKPVQGRQDFHTSTLDLGTLDRSNVDNELHNRDADANARSYGYQQSYSSGSAPNGGATYHQSAKYSSGGQPYYGTEDRQYYGQRHDGQQYSPLSQRSSAQRFRRDTPEPTQIDMNSPCLAAKCETLRCVAKNLSEGDGVWVAIRTRMVAKTMEKLAANVPLNVSTMAVAYVTSLPYIGKPKDEINKSHEIFFKAVPEPIPVPNVVPLWVVVLAACAGALILLLLVFLLYKCGFFKRNRPTGTHMERQPLRNGYHGDEHL